MDGGAHVVWEDVVVLADVDNKNSFEDGKDEGLLAFENGGGDSKAIDGFAEEVMCQLTCVLFIYISHA